MAMLVYLFPNIGHTKNIDKRSTLADTGQANENMINKIERVRKWCVVQVS